MKNFQLRCHLWQREVLTPFHLPSVSTCTYFHGEVTGQLPQETLSLAGQDSTHHVQPGLSRGVSSPISTETDTGYNTSIYKILLLWINCNVNRSYYQLYYKLVSKYAQLYMLCIVLALWTWTGVLSQPPEPSEGCSACSTTCSWEPLIC